MIIYTLRRLSLLIITVFILTIIGYGLKNYGQPLSAESHTKSSITGYSQYIADLSNGDFGLSSVSGEELTPQLLNVFPATLELCLLAFIVSLIIGIPLGLLAGARRGRWQDMIISAFALFGFSIPVFWLGILLIMLFSLNLGWLPISGQHSLLYEVERVTGFILVDAWLSSSPYRHDIIYNTILHMALPVITLSLSPTTEVIRLMRASTEHVVDKPYVKVAVTRGWSRLTILRRPILRNALPPIIPKLGLLFSTMLTLAMITETVFSWPGIGRWLIQALNQHDYTAISAGVVVVGSSVILLSVLAELFGAAVNPLVRKEWYEVR
ncbi:MAG: putrescine export ABC transporter permease SapB [Plesiomonas sp.]|uniref:putrescine export ABC transporter permease SapB n=1 Tax=Plesiomonas sp. TaxID=2486279 RepID=UPI003F2FB11B